MQQVNIAEAQTQLPGLVEAAMRGIEVIVTKENRSVVKPVPLPQAVARPQFGSAKGLIAMSDDFDAPLEDFNDHMK
jgi:antitoxin (DNA-binding transcriptional repressor) of toxin-antitoxin stability system